MKKVMPPVKPVGLMTESWFRDNSVEKELKDQWINNGFSILRKVYNTSEIDQYNQIVAEVRTQVNDGKDEQGYGDRIGQLHQKYPELLNLACEPRVLSFLKWAFNDDPVVFGSLNFERGTQQDAHIDAIFFWPEPSYSMCGCWVALEDIHPSSGPLFYVPESHGWPFFRSQDIADSRPDLALRRSAVRNPQASAEERAAVVGELGKAWTDEFHKLERKKQSKRLPISLRAGDVVFWHSLLAHGGSPRLDPKLSRKSVVFHYIGKRTRLYTFEQFMLYDELEMLQQQEQPMNLRRFKNIEYMHYPHFVTYTPEGQTVHPLDD
jgi:ectoine hydroxylase-related dioxygenase (phytanoyl-CoA dioxygenase family)